MTISPKIVRGSGKVSSKVVHFQFTDIKISYTKAKQTKTKTKPNKNNNNKKKPKTKTKKTLGY